jgi:hypothetical protein
MVGGVHAEMVVVNVSIPPPWTVEALESGFKIVDANKQAVAYVYGHADKRDVETAKGLTLDEARRIAAHSQATGAIEELASYRADL